MEILTDTGKEYRHWHKESDKIWIGSRPRTLSSIQGPELSLPKEF